MDKKKIVVLGAGESGAGAAVLAKVKGFEVFVSDMSTIKEKYKELLNKYEIEWEEQTHTYDRIIDADEVIKSPGIPDTAPLIVALTEKGTPIISEIEFAGRYTDARMICITGSNGKTTTTLLTYHILKSAGLKVGLAGNVGQSLALQVATCDYDYYVVELSSFQLDNMYDFRADIAVLLNITPDHLDRYDHKMENYIDAKFRITRNQTNNDAFIYWNDDPVINEKLRTLQLQSRVYPFGETPDAQARAYTQDHRLIIKTDDDTFTMDESELALHGRHNLYNSLAAGISANLLHIEKEDIRRALSDFQAVEHRLEPVATVKGVRFINDSKATNVNSCWYALESMDTPVVLILGGKDKGNDYSEIEQLVLDKVKAIICMGVDNSKLHAFFDGKVPYIADAGSMQEAVALSYQAAVPGDTVLLSPCCASFDLFTSYEDRGAQFKACVRQL
ncbi:MAG: UDP-N-acetylmuramoyl-L-alanine--D-glutamate ligase [Bacteroidaceae bacterium]|nr:UDP-N-acetylmuramoyl-L-alanine--D-glutamate ligase [Bacteroidaceae bacterium]